ncbi:MAG: hypothetical protein U9N30_09165 [Campylobacterota bacterium]|nr:hypothetical protein [Campylobacterota bacterium]
MDKMKEFEAIWTRSAEFDLELIIEYIKKECDNLYYFPKRKRIVPELQQSER